MNCLIVSPVFNLISKVYPFLFSIRIIGIAIRSKKYLNQYQRPGKKDQHPVEFFGAFHFSSFEISLNKSISFTFAEAPR